MTQPSFSLSTGLALATLIGLIPILAVVASSYTKITVVLLIVRNAIGIQQTPPNLLLFAIATILSAFIMMPVLEKTSSSLSQSLMTATTPDEVVAAAREASAPLKQFMKKYSEARTQTFFEKAAQKTWAEDETTTRHVDPDDVMILAPTFMVSELNRAFKIGFLIYLPFLMIDFVVSALLIALGMTMMSPTIISTPFKLLFFVSIDGWRRLLEGLVLSYAGS